MRRRRTHETAPLANKIADKNSEPFRTDFRSEGQFRQLSNVGIDAWWQDATERETDVRFSAHSEFKTAGAKLKNKQGSPAPIRCCDPRSAAQLNFAPESN
jgi:hypothetical protein